MRWARQPWLRAGNVRSLLVVSFCTFLILKILSPGKVGHPTPGDEEEEEGEATVGGFSQQERRPQPRQEEHQGKEVSTSKKVPPLDSDDPTLGPYDDWMQVVGSDRKFFVYSAYLDRRGNFNDIRVVAIVKRGKKATKCQVWRGNGTERVQATTRIIRENWNLPYSAAYILCRLSDGGRPSRVAVLGDGRQAADAGPSLPVQDLSEGRQPMGDLSVCVKPLHYGFDRAVWLVEFIEFYRLLGAGRFVFYNHTTGGHVDSVLEYYRGLGVAAVLPWSLPVETQKEIRTEGIFAALNDCNLRSVNRFHLTAMVDLDEFLVPRGHASLLDLVSSFGSFDDVYVFQNVFFYLYWENDTAVHDVLFHDEQSLGNTLFGSEAYMPYLLTAYKTKRLTQPHPYGQRSKYIVRPKQVLEVGNHIVWEHVAKSSKKVKRVPPEVGLSQHYRICEFGGFDCLKQASKVDRVAHEWLVPLVKEVAESCSKIFPSQGRCPTAPPLGSPW